MNPNKALWEKGDFTRIAQTMRESGERFRSIVETANEGMWTVDAQLITTFVNEKMAEM